ncbi:MAG: nucleotidyltransferase family protein [Ruminococcus sp.]|nr:nucleotidyltransferase family protein [Ruminococcus sp.]
MNKKFEDVIAEQGRLVYRSEGDSMIPVIREGNLLVIEAVKEPLKVGDIPLYKRDSGQYVLHRIVGIKKGKYSMKGDNRDFIEKGITDKHIIGVLTGIVRNGKTYPVETMQEYIVRIAKDLIYLVSCAVNEETPNKARIAEMDLAEVYRLSVMHMLTAAVAYALEKVMPLPHAFDQAKKKAIRKLTLFELERAAITQEFEKAGIWYLPLKGILLKDDYPEPFMREMTDNDILVDNTRMDDIKEIMEGLGYTCETYDMWCHDVYSKPPTLEFELHRILFQDEEMSLFAKYYADISDKLKRNGYECKLSDEDFYLYVLCHTYKHYIHGGTGLRSLLDVYVFLRSHPNLNRDYLNAELAKLQISEFEEKQRRLSQKVFTGAELNEQEQYDLDYLIMSGYKGTYENQEYHSMEKSLGGDDSKESKRRFIKSRIIVSDEYLEKHYPYVAKHRALYPLLLVWRPVKGVFTHPRGILTEYKKIISFRKKDEP